MLRFALTLTLIGAFVVPAVARPHVSAYERCLTRVIASHGFAWTVAHAGATRCD